MYRNSLILSFTATATTTGVCLIQNLIFLQAYRLHLIENSLQILIKPGGQLNSINGDQSLRKTKIPDALSYVQLIMENSVICDAGSGKSPITIIGNTFI